MSPIHFYILVAIICTHERNMAFVESLPMSNPNQISNFPKSASPMFDHSEELYREFISVTSESEQEIKNRRPSITQSIFVTSSHNNSTAEFFNRFLRMDHYETPFTTLTFRVDAVSVVPDILNQISSFYGKYFSDEISLYPRYPFLIIIPQPNKSESNGSIHATKSEIEKLILNKMDRNSVNNFVIDSSIFLAFSKAKMINQDQESLDIWELYSIKNKTFLRHVNEPLTLVNGRLLKESHLMRRQDWEGVEVEYATFSSSANEMGEIEGISKYELELRRGSHGDGEFKIGKGLSSSIVSDFETALNFTSKILHPYKEYTDLNAFFEKYDNAFDICVTHHGLNPERLKLVRHLLPTYFDGITAYFVQPPVHTFRNIYVTPFAPSMWGMMFVTWIVILFSFKLIIHIRTAIRSPTFWSYEVEVRENERDEQVTREVVWWAIAAACQQGWYMTPGTTPTRLVFFTGLLFSLLCYAAYTATIVSELWDNIVPIRSMEGLLANSKEVYLINGTDVGSLIWQGMKQRDPHLLQKVRLTDLPTAVNNVIDINRGSSCVLDWSEYFVETSIEMFSKRIQKGYEDDDEQHNSEVELCQQVRSFRYEYLSAKASMFVPKKSPFRKMLNFRIAVGVERGLFRRYWNEYTKNTRVRCLEESNKTYALGIYDTWIVFAILVTGYGLSIGIFVFEIIHSKVLLARVGKKMK